MKYHRWRGKEGKERVEEGAKRKWGERKERKGSRCYCDFSQHCPNIYSLMFKLMLSLHLGFHNLIYTKLCASVFLQPQIVLNAT